MIPLRLVIDTNIVVSAALKLDGLQRTVLLLATAKPATLYVSEAVLDEYREVVARPEFKIRKGLRQQLLQLIESRAHSIKPSRAPQVTRTRTATSSWNAPMPHVPITSSPETHGISQNSGRRPR